MINGSGVEASLVGAFPRMDVVSVVVVVVVVVKKLGRMDSKVIKDERGDRTDANSALLVTAALSMSLCVMPIFSSIFTTPPPSAAAVVVTARLLVAVVFAPRLHLLRTFHALGCCCGIIGDIVEDAFLGLYIERLLPRGDRRYRWPPGTSIEREPDTF